IRVSMEAMPARLSPAVRNHWTITGRCPETGWNECPRRASNLHKWLRTAKGKRRGLDVLRSRKGTGRPPKLTKSQQRQVFRWINGKDPRQYGFDFGLWTRRVVSELVADRFGIDLSLASVGKLLANVGLTPQKPLTRAYERDPEAIETWKRETYP